MDDLISRQAAIDAINEFHELPNAWLDLAVDTLEKLPSVQLIRCRECAKWNTVFDRSKAEYGLCKIRSQLETTRYDDFCRMAERKEE